MKKFLIKISYTVFPLWLITVGIVLYLSIYLPPRISGDIGRLGLIPFGKQYPERLNKCLPVDTLFPTIRKTEDLRNVYANVLTIGDSFSQQGNGGYQNYLCLKGLSVANCYRHLYSSTLQYAYWVLDEQLIDSTNIHFLIVECVERYFEDEIKAFSTLKKRSETPVNRPKGKEDSNKWSIARARDFVFYKLRPNTPPIYTSTLDQDLFTSDAPRKLFFLYEDIDKGVSISKDNEMKMKTVFNTLTQKAKEKGIKLFLLVAVDKYDLYQHHIMNNRWPKKTVMEDIERIIGATPTLLLSKQILLPLVEKGEKDVFKFNDTHWSYKAASVVADELYQRMTTEGILKEKKMTQDEIK